MHPFRLKTTLALIVSLASATAFLAQEPKAAPADDDVQVIKSKPTKVKPAAAINFRKEYGLPLASLGTLGSRIDSARRAGDPVALGHTAGELDVAEQVSGKSASLTSKQLLSEAAELASIRKQNAELRSVLQMSQKISLAQNQLTVLKDQIASTKAMTEASKRALEMKEEPTNAPRKIIVNNYSIQYIEIQINGYTKGLVDPGTSKVFTIDQMWNPIVVKGWGDSDETTFGPMYLKGKFDKYTWNIHNDDGVPDLPR